jgi:hypothetical protein
MTKLRDIFDLPERVNDGDFVLKLTDGLDAPAETVRNYVVTPSLAECFDEALGLIKGAMESTQSAGAYLHGSFGAGKSHFMAILTLLLRGDTNARGKPELAKVVAKHDGWTKGKKFLVVPYHMIGYDSMEAAIFSGYAELTKKLHPDAPRPGFYQSEGIVRDACALREKIGDDAFFKTLNADGGTSGGGGWGKLAQTWDAARFDAALQTEATTPEHFQFVGALTRAFFANASETRAADTELYTSLDDGLAAMSCHARDLGYDGIILFLDEFILWLATRIGDVQWIAREGQKVSKLVESGNADRPIPIVSFMARQRDLRGLVGDHALGAQQQSFLDVLQHWEARFACVNLEDRNLPEIAKKRLLKSKPGQEAELQRAIDKLIDGNKAVVETLKTSAGDEQMLRDLYPFTPALVQTLIATSHLLQRERTALKLMLQMLVERANTMELGEVIPVGDLFNVISKGDEPFSAGIKKLFDQAKNFWSQKLLPMLERQHGVTLEEIKENRADAAKTTAFRNDERLIKTLMLTPLAQDVDALKNLTPTKLAALNHGTIRSPIPGAEGSTVLNKLKKWAGQVGAIKIGDDNAANPVITITIGQVDTDIIVTDAGAFDNIGNRQELVRAMICDNLGLIAGDLADEPRMVIYWRGSRREIELHFGNVRTHSFETIKGREDRWRILVDFPFDPESGHGPQDDVAHLNEFTDADNIGHSIAWLPSFLAPNTLDQVGKLVIINNLLAGENLDRYARTLSSEDREQARGLLQNQRDQLKQAVRNYLETAYGLNSVEKAALDPTQSMTDGQHFYSTHPSLELRPPVAGTFREAFEKLAEQALNFEFPAHPHFDIEPKTSAVKKLADELIQAAQQPQYTLELEPTLRADAERIAKRLELANVGETKLQLRDDTWKQHFTREIARNNVRELKVGDLRRWLDEPERRGLREDLQDLIILTWLAVTNQSLSRMGKPFQGAIGNLPDDCGVLKQPLPSEEDWNKATERAGELLDGKLGSLFRAQLPSAPGMTKLAKNIKDTVNEKLPDLLAYKSAIAILRERVNPEDGDPLREKLANRLCDWFTALSAERADLSLVNRFAQFTLDAAESSEARIVLADVANLMSIRIHEQSIKSLRSMQERKDGFAVRASDILDTLAQAVLQYEYVTHIDEALRRFDEDAGQLMQELARQSVTPTPDPKPTTRPGERIRSTIDKSGLDPAAARRELAAALAAVEAMGEGSVDVRIVIRERE